MLHPSPQVQEERSSLESIDVGIYSVLLSNIDKSYIAELLNKPNLTEEEFANTINTRRRELRAAAGVEHPFSHDRFGTGGQFKSIIRVLILSIQHQHDVHKPK